MASRSLRKIIRDLETENAQLRRQVEELLAYLQRTKCGRSAGMHSYQFGHDIEHSLREQSTMRDTTPRKNLSRL